MKKYNNDDHLVILMVRLYNAKYRMEQGEPGQRARFHLILNAFGNRRRELASSA